MTRTFCLSPPHLPCKDLVLLACLTLSAGSPGVRCSTRLTCPPTTSPTAQSDYATSNGMHAPPPAQAGLFLGAAGVLGAGDSPAGAAARSSLSGSGDNGAGTLVVALQHDKEVLGKQLEEVEGECLRLQVSPQEDQGGFVPLN